MSDAPAPDAGLNALVGYLQSARGFDFTGYEPSQLHAADRQAHGPLGCGTYGEYIDYLEVHPDEFASLFNTILINVTASFRDPPAWEYLRDEIVPG